MTIEQIEKETQIERAKIEKMALFIQNSISKNKHDSLSILCVASP